MESGLDRAPEEWEEELESEEEEEEEETTATRRVESFQRERHVMYMQMMYQLLPHHYQFQEINRLTLACFVISGLDLLGALDTVDKDAVASWVLSLQAHPNNRAELNDGQFYGFHGSRTSQFPIASGAAVVHNCSHLASTYCALAILKIIGYDIASIDADLILTSMRNLQQPDGSFVPIHIGGEKDLRFIYCAAAICFMLGDWKGMDVDRAKDFIVNCQSYDGGFGLIPASESHGGATYCAIASLKLMGYIEDDLLSKSSSSPPVDVPLLLDWLLQRQASDGGLQGRANKPSDTCYGFWIGAVLRILGAQKFINNKALCSFLLTCQSQYGGFGKVPGQLPDLYHSYYGLAALSLLEEPSMSRMCVELGITHFAA